MPKHSTPEHSTTPRLRSGGEPPTERLSRPAESPTPAKAPDLSVNKVIAGAGAAATSAILGSYFGAAGTVTGAALGSVASTIASVVYQRSLDHTRDSLVARVRLTPGKRPDVAQPVAADPETRLDLPVQRVAPEAETVQLRVEPAIRPPGRRRAWLWLGATVLVFSIGLLAVTGIEWAKGSSITTGETGTSVGRVIDGNRDTATPTEEPQPTSTPEPTQSTEPSTDATGEPTPSTSPESSATQTPAPSSRSGPGGSGAPGNGQSGTQPTPLIPAPLVPGE
jgi:hypothetical protein